MMVFYLLPLVYLVQSNFSNCVAAPPHPENIWIKVAEKYLTVMAAELFVVHNLHSVGIIHAGSSVRVISKTTFEFYPQLLLELLLKSRIIKNWVRIRNLLKTIDLNQLPSNFSWKIICCDLLNHETWIFYLSDINLVCMNQIKLNLWSLSL